MCVVPNQLLNIHIHTYLIWQKIQFPQLNSNPGHCYSPTQVDTRRMSWPSAPLLSWYDPITETGPKKQSHVHTNSNCHQNQLRGGNTLNEKDPRTGRRGLPLVPGYPQRRWPNFLEMMSLINCAQIRTSAVVLTRWSDWGITGSWYPPLVGGHSQKICPSANFGIDDYTDYIDVYVYV